jgi:ATP-dependent DNA helicase RecG
MSYDRGPLSEAQLSDIDQQALASYVAQRAPTLHRELGAEDAASRLGLTHKSGPRMLPTPAGLLLFGLVPQLMHPEWGLSALRVDGRSMSDPIAAREDLEGPLGQLLDRGLAFVREHTHTLTNQAQPDSQAEEYPLGAVREALVNALLHRDLRKSGRVALRIFDDRLEVWSPGGPPDAAGDLDDLAQDGGVSMPRNPLLAATARTLGLGEQLGRGLPTMRRAVAASSALKLDIRCTMRDVLVTFPSRLLHPRDRRALS